MNVAHSLRGSVKNGSNMKDKFWLWSLCIGIHSYMNCLRNYNRIGIFPLWNYVTRSCLPLCFTVRHLTPVSQAENMYLKFRQYIEQY